MTFPLSLHPNPTIGSITSRALQPLAIAGGLGLLTYAGACFALYHYQNRLIFRPLSTLVGTPAELGLAYEDVWIPVRQTFPNNSQSEVGQLHAWWLPHPGSDRVLLFCHGNYGNISYNTERIRFHHSLGFSVLAFDYRGYGYSTSTVSAPTEQTTYTDAEAAWQYLTNQKQIAPENITVCGHSMGGAIAIDLATRHPDIARLIVKSSFTTMKDAINARKTYQFFPIEQLLSHPFDSLSKVQNLKMPVLYVHGAQDFDVPAKFSEQLYAATPEPKLLWIAPDANHNNISMVQGETYGAVVKDFCNSKQLQPATIG